MRTTLTKITAMLMVVFLWASVSTVQGQIITTASTVTACPGSTDVLVPITVENFNSVASISLKLNVQPSNVLYVGYTVHPIITAAGGFLIVNGPNPPSSSHIAAAFFGLNNISIPDGEALFTFRFNVTNSSTLTWNLTEQGACQYSDLAGETQPAIFNNGAINAGLPFGNISSTPFICSGQPADVTINVTSGSAPYTLVYNDGVNPDVTVNTSTNPYTFQTFPTAATTYTLVSITAAGGCSSEIGTSTTTGFFPSAEVFTVTGGGSFCNGGAGVEVGLSGSQTGVTYELFLDGTTTGQYISGTGAAISFGNQTVAGSYTITGANDCGTVFMDGQANVSLSAGPEVSLAAQPDLCESVDTWALSGGFPLGGVYSGIGVSNDMFFPSMVGAGTYEITYTYTDESGCVGTANASINVIPLPIVSLSANTPVCVGSDPLMLYGYPEGGNFYGLGVVFNYFYPSVQTIGVNTVEYVYTNESGCSSTATFDIEVIPIPAITIEPIQPVCVNSGAVQLEISPLGGWIDGPGAYENEGFYYFNPAVAGIFTVTYHYTSAEGCYASATVDIQVEDYPQLSFDPIPDQCSYASGYELVATPAGGVFSGPGVVNNQFNANLVEPGYYEILYSYSAPSGCSNTATQLVNVLYPVVPQMYYTDVVCADEDTVTLIGYPSGGTFSGLGVSEGYFLPNTLGEGTYTLVYTYTDEHGCVSSVSGTITVNPVPEIVFNALAPVCLGTEYVALTASPAGGNFEGYNVYQDGEGMWYFYANSIEPGVYTITYNYTNGQNCFASASQQLVVNALPEVTIDPVADVCYGSEPVQLNGTPAGGVFSGIGVNGTMFVPAGLNPDYYTITYTYTDENGCSNSASTYLYINGLPELYFTAPSPVCVSAEAMDLYAFPTGGIFSGNGIVDGLFVPSVAGVGTHFVTYTYTDVLGCTNSITDTMVVNPLPEIVLGQTPEQVCFNSSPVLLSAVPAGGEFSGPGVYYNGNDYEFWPDYGFLGENVIVYTVSNEYGCSKSSSFVIMVNSAPVVSIEPVMDLCAGAPAYELTGIPAGGVFSGNAVVGNTFVPSLASTVEYNIVTYTYTDENGCSNSAMTSIWVNQGPSIEIVQVGELCLSSDPVQLFAYPTGGTFSGNGVENNMFNPLLAGIGTSTVVYNYTDGYGCSGSAEIQIVVFESPVVTFAPLAPVCQNAGSVELMATPAGGYFEGPGVEGNFFYPGFLNEGEYTLTYYYNAGNNCSGSATQTILVMATPQVSLQPVAPVCIDVMPFELTGTPVGGTFSGYGVVGNEFHPSIAGIGITTVTYSYTDPVSGCSATASIEINVLSTPQVISHPVNQAINAGDNASFSANAVNVTAYQWQVSEDNGISWVNLTNGGVYSGVTSEVLQLTNVPLSFNGNLYQVLAFGDCPTYAMSYSALLSVESSAIDVTVGSVEACAGEIVVPVTVANVNNVASISLTLSFDPSVLTYTHYSDVNPALDGGMYSINVIGNQIKFGYFSITPLQFGNGLLFNYHFTSEGGISDLSWDITTPGNCQFTNLAEDIIPSNYFNGTVTVNALPMAFELLGGGVYCAGTDGKEISMSGSETGVLYTLLLDGISTGVQFDGTGSAMSLGYYMAAGSYTVSSVNMSTNCIGTISNPVIIGVNTEMNALAGDDVTIFDGSSTILGVSVTGGTAPYSYSWTPAFSLDDASLASPTASPIVTTLYTVVVTDVYGCTAADEVLVTVIEPADQFSGYVTYDNDAASPMANIPVELYSGGTLVASTTTGPNGEYEFTDLPNGTYTVKASTTKEWGGGNAADGLLMLKHFVGNPLLTGMRLMAGDVSGNGVINSLDALTVLKRFTQFISSFGSVPDWYIEQPTVTIDGFVAPVVNIKAICMGDVNGDYIPPYLKPEPTITLDREGSVALVNGKASVPVTALQSMELGAISMILHVPAGLTVTRLTMNATQESMVFNQIGQEVRIGWYNLVPVEIQAGQPIFTMDVVVTNNADGEILLDGYSTLSDVNAGTIYNAGINMPKLTVSSMTNSLGIYPNPSRENASINFSLANSGMVQLAVYNVLGEQVLTLINELKDAGTYQVNLNVSDLNQGNYLLKLQTNEKVMTQTIQVIK